jgi:serine/threonine protein kinase
MHYMVVQDFHTDHGNSQKGTEFKGFNDRIACNIIQRSEMLMSGDAVSELMAVVQAKGYTLLKEIGRGATARCYLAHSNQYDENYVVKAMPIAENRPGELETDALKQLAAPNIIYLYDVVRSRDCLYLFLEYCPSGSLIDVIQKQGVLQGLELQRISRGILDGLVYIHSRQFAHLDMKPANVLIDRFGRPKLADFGLSRRFSHDQPKMKHTAGTLCYVAPEMFGPSTCDPFKADIWAFGVTCYVIAFGGPPWRASTIQEMQDEIATREITFPEDCDPLFASAVMAMLTIDPSARPTAEQCLELPFFETAYPRMEGLQRRLVTNKRSGSELSLHVGPQISGSLPRLAPAPRLVIPCVRQGTEVACRIARKVLPL